MERAEKRKRKASSIEQARKEVEEAIQQFNGNPATERALKAMNKRIDEIAEWEGLKASRGEQ